MEYEIIHLPKEKWKGTIIPIKYKTHKYYDVIVNKIDSGFAKGKFYEAEVFENLPKEEVEEYNKKFPQLQKLRFPGQWD